MDRSIQTTTAAQELIDQLRDQHGPLMFHLGGGCCGGSAPMCMKAGELITDDNDVYCGQVHGCDFWMAKDPYKTRQRDAWILDVVKGGGASFSLEIPLQVRFVLRTKHSADSPSS